MNDIPWKHLVTIEGRINADSLAAYLQANGIETELFQEGYGSLVPLSFGPLSEVQIFVPNENYDEALNLLKTFQEGSGSENNEGDGQE